MLLLQPAFSVTSSFVYPTSWRWMFAMLKLSPWRISGQWQPVAAFDGRRNDRSCQHVSRLLYQPNCALAD